MRGADVMGACTVLKIGGELLETPGDLRRVTEHISRIASEGALVVVHGGGRELTTELSRRGSVPRMVDGIRVTDAAALDVAVSVLAGTINTRLVAALTACAVPAVGLTGVDGRTLLSRLAAPMRSGSGLEVDPGHVGDPVEASETALVGTLCAAGWIPVVASIGISTEGRLLNINADVAAAHLAIALGARRLVVAGGTDGVLGADGRTVPELSHADARALVRSGAARDGMAAKLDACTRASAAGVVDVRIINGRHDHLDSGTRVLPASPQR